MFKDFLRMRKATNVVVEEPSVRLDNLVLWVDGEDFKNSPPSTALIDKSVRGNNLIAVNMGYTETSGSDGQGGVAFDGVNDLMRTEINQDFDFGNGDFTLFVRYKIPSLPPAYVGILSKRVTGTSGVSFYIRYNVVSSRFEARFSISGTSTEYDLYKVQAHPLNEFVEIAVTRTGNRLAMMINGVEVVATTTIGTQAIFTSSSPLSIAAFKNSSTNTTSYTYFAPITFEGVAIYKGVALSTEELNSISNYYTGGSGGSVVPEMSTVSAVYLTLDQDTKDKGSESMYVHYHVQIGKEELVYYKKSSEVNWITVPPNISLFQNENISICHAHLYGLQSNTEYVFRIGDTVLNGEYKFLTLPSTLEEGVTFKGAFGSDMQTDFSRCATMTNIIGMNDCRFFVMSGDWADDNATLSYSYRWKDLLNAILPVLKDTQGRLIPIMAGIGNHEVTNYSGLPEMNRPFIMDMFGFTDRAYNVVDFGDYLSLIMLDSEVEKIPTWGVRAGYNFNTQTQWLQETLPVRTDKKFIIPTYHTPKYPAHTGSIRNDAWIAQFEQNGVKACFESHDHVRKKTFKIKNETIDANGIIYFGGGTMGAKFYAGDNVGLWYIDEYNKNMSHVNIVEFSSTKMTVNVINENNQIISITDISANGN